MPYSTIIVQRRDGSPIKSAKVALGFDGFLSGGVTNSHYTDAHGIVVIEHRSTGYAKVYVNGQHLESFHSPGKCVVTI